MTSFEIKYDAPDGAEEEKAFALEAEALEFAKFQISKGATLVYLCGSDGCAIRRLD